MPRSACMAGVFFFICVFVIGTCATGCQESGVAGAAAESQGIVGPSTTDWESWPAVVGLVIYNGQAMCTGTLIDPQLVLTAGHCGDPNPAGIQVMSGPEMYSGELIAFGEEIVFHPAWPGMLAPGAVDLSMIKLDRAVTGIEPMRLRDFPLPDVGTPAKLVGYGADGSSGPSGGAGVQRVGDTTLLEVLPGMLGTGDPSNTCSGDSGGPVFTEQDGEWVVSGVNSAVTGTCNPLMGGIAVNLLGFCSWLNETATALVGHDLGLEYCKECTADFVKDWGHGCGPELPPCPDGTTCTLVTGYSKDGYGYCAAPCCEVDSMFDTSCYNVGDGEEKCALLGEQGGAFCAIYCEDDSECPEYTECYGPFSQPGMCIAREGIPGYEPDTGEEGQDTGADSDAGAEPDTNTGVDADASIDGGDTDTSSENDCDCETMGMTRRYLVTLALSLI